MPVIGYLSSFSRSQSEPAIAAVRRGLLENGLVEGRSVAIEFRFSDGQYDRLPGLATELVRRPVDLIIAAPHRRRRQLRKPRPKRYRSCSLLALTQSRPDSFRA